jgi:hypothetical protein
LRCDFPEKGMSVTGAGYAGGRGWKANQGPSGCIMRVI